MVSEVLSQTLAHLPRSEQRRWGELYVRGLLSVDGRKTMRALAGGAGSAAEKSLYQFITKSPWSNGAVRRELARTLQDAMAPKAWVVRPLVVAKDGRHSVGVDRQWVPDAGRLVNCQQSTSVWLAGEDESCPVDWRLALPGSWADSPEQRRRAAIPEHVGGCPPERCALDSVHRMARDWGLWRRPVVMDLRAAGPAPLAELMAARLPFVARVDPADPRLLLEPGHRTADAWRGAADGLGEAIGRRRMPVEWPDPATGTLRATVVGSVPVRLRGPRALPHAPHTGRQELVLLGAWAPGARRGPTEFWLSSLAGEHLGTVYRTAMLSRRVDHDLDRVSDGLGVRDFEGRTFRGWHHHMTMVSLAHALTVLAAAPAADRLRAAPRTLRASAA
ncbi:transposase [Streptomyces sp. NPDC089919]|uniref:IS701 family transposase n=1 Tax=Streptomyces sp. NPDC089919 TaxID=3155188 RepID=UPI00341CCB5F